MPTFYEAWADWMSDTSNAILSNQGSDQIDTSRSGYTVSGGCHAMYTAYLPWSTFYPAQEVIYQSAELTSVTKTYAELALNLSIPYLYYSPDITGNGISDPTTWRDWWRDVLIATFTAFGHTPTSVDLAEIVEVDAIGNELHWKPGYIYDEVDNWQFAATFQTAHAATATTTGQVPGSVQWGTSWIIPEPTVGSAYEQLSGAPSFLSSPWLAEQPAGTAEIAALNHLADKLTLLARQEVRLETHQSKTLLQVTAGAGTVVAKNDTMDNALHRVAQALKLCIQKKIIWWDPKSNGKIILPDGESLI